MTPAERGVAAALLLSALGSAAFAVAYALSSSIQLMGIGLTAALLGAAVAIALWAKHVLPQEQVVDARDELPGPAPAREEIAAAFGGERDPLARRTLLARLLAGAAGALGIALLFPARSFGTNPAPYRSHSVWRAGMRLVREDGTPVREGDLEYGSILTVFPEGHVDDSLAQTLLIRPEPAMLLAFSKVCTHAGCPVGLYRQASYELLCPCHQSAFDVLDGAKPVSGPATRPLPALPISTNAAGYLVATGDFEQPVGPASWSRSS